MVKKAAESKPNKLLQAARKEHNWTQKEVADRIGAPQSFNISRWEQGTAFPSAHYIQQLCLLFGKSARELGLQLEEPAASSELSTEAGTLPIWNVPYRRNPFFTGREQILEQLHDWLATTQCAALTQTQAISGLGGIGKTQIAVEYAYRSRESYRDVLWMRAASRETLLSDYVALGHLLNLPGRDTPEQQLIVEAVKRWLIGHQGWLLILDNADDLVLTSEFLPAGGQGHVLLTTRAQATGTLAPGIGVEQLGREEGVLLLLRRAKLLAPTASLDAVEVATLAVAQAIVAAMDGLPLALDQAGAYIEETGCSLSEYHALFQQHRRELLSRRSRVAPDYPYSVVSTWSLAFEQVEQENPATADLLRLCAFLHPDAIPEALLVEGAAVLDTPLQMLARDTFQRNEALEGLRKYSLVRRHPQTKVLSIHRLVQVVLREELDEQTQRQWAELAVCVIEAAFPEAKFENWQRCQEYLPHAQTCAELIEQYHLTFPEAARLLMRAGSYLRDRGLYAQATPFLHRALALSEQTMEPGHPQAAEILNNLAQLYHDQGQYAQAESLYQRALSIQEQTPGPANPQTAEILNNLAFLYHYQGKYTQAEPLYQRALALCEQTLGSDHPDTAMTLGNLALLYHYQGKYVQAESLYQRALAIQERALGSDHPDTAITLSNLALHYWRLGRYTQAESLYQRALTLKERAVGPDHPDIAITLGNLALIYQYQGKYAQTEPLYQRALAIQERALGPDHPITAMTLGNLALLYHDQGQYTQAEPLYQRALALKEQTLGPEHIDTAMTLGNVARLYTDQGRYKQAEPLHQRALALREQAVGPEHLDTAIALDNLGHFYDLQGQYEQAESLMQRALTIFEHTVVPEHPRLATVLIHLAQLYEHQACYAQAKPLYRRALTIREQVLGSEHPSTIAVRASYTDTLGQIERMTEAAKIADPD